MNFIFMIYLGIAVFTVIIFLLWFIFQHCESYNFSDADADLVVWLVDNMVPYFEEHLKIEVEDIKFTRWGKLKKIYIFCSKDGKKSRYILNYNM